jgi:ABC-2 type transport system ATP-binding protein
VKAIVFDQITKIYSEGFKKKKTAVDQLTLEVPQGAVFGFLGPNGAGKSTAIKILLNILFPTSGKAYLLGHTVLDKTVRSRVGYLPENPYFYDHLTPEELLWFGGKTSGLTPTQIRERTDSLLKIVDLIHVRRKPLRAFSKGMVQRAGLALALVNDPEVVILDEPMSGLDPLGRKLMSDIIRRLKMEGKTVFFSSHILHDVEDLCDRIGIIVNGLLRLTAGLSELLSSPPKGWRITVRGDEGTLASQLVSVSWKLSINGVLTEIQAQETDLHKLMEQIRGFKCDVVAVAPLRETLEEIFLCEIQKAGIKPL